MKIFGIGTDIVNIKRMEKLSKKNNKTFKLRIFSKMKLPIVIKKKIPLHFIPKDLLLKRL